MATLINVKRLTTPEKLRLMEEIWHDLSDADVTSPDWHGDVLAERDRLIHSGEDSFVEWEAAKRELRQELQ